MPRSARLIIAPCPPAFALAFRCEEWEVNQHELAIGYRRCPSWAAVCALASRLKARKTQEATKGQKCSSSGLSWTINATSPSLLLATLRGRWHPPLRCNPNGSSPWSTCVRKRQSPPRSQRMAQLARRSHGPIPQETGAPRWCSRPRSSQSVVWSGFQTHAMVKHAKYE